MMQNNFGMFVTHEVSFQNIEFSEQEDFFSFFDLFRNIFEPVLLHLCL